MTTTSIAKASLHLIAGFSLALLVAAGNNAAFAHGGGHNGGDHFSNGGDHFGNDGDHVSNGGHGRCINCGAGHGVGGENIDSNYWRHHHHHRTGSGPGGLGRVHGPGSSHNPIVYHPPMQPIPKPIIGVGPAKPTGTTVVRDHRTPQPHGGRRFNPNCNQHNITGCEIRDHRTPPTPQCYGDLC